MVFRLSQRLTLMSHLSFTWLGNHVTKQSSLFSIFVSRRTLTDICIVNFIFLKEPSQLEALYLNRISITKQAEVI